MRADAPLDTGNLGGFLHGAVQLPGRDRIGSV